MNIFKNIGEHLVYGFSIFLSVLIKIGLIGSVAFCALLLINNEVFVDEKINLRAYACFGIFVVCLILEKPASLLCVQSREVIEFDENGNKRRNKYKYMSAKDKKEIDKKRLTDQERLMGTGEFKKITHEGSRTPEIDLEKLIGLKEIKTEIKKMKAKMEYDKTYEKKRRRNRQTFICVFLEIQEREKQQLQES